MTTLSVVLIAKDQAWNVDRLVCSVLREIADGPPAEVLFVDSASQDGTAQRAARHPIGVLRLRSDQPLTPALGRYVGARETSGELLLFLDGDMELCPGWLAAALQTMHERPEVAAVTGAVIDRPRDTQPGDGTWSEQVRQPDDAERDVTQTGGAALHRRRVLEAVGSFHPYLHSEEEPELCLRIRHAGHRVVRIGRPIALHYTTPSRTVATVMARWRRDLFLGMGQSMRHHLGSDLLWPYIRERGWGLAPGMALLAGLGGLGAGIAAGRWRPLGLWTALTTSTIAVHAVRRRSVTDTAFSLVQRLCLVDGTVRGFLADPLPPEAHPARFEVVQPLPAATGGTR
jgi:glycosyltransferase involved in cell wall biosynthesis